MLSFISQKRSQKRIFQGRGFSLCWAALLFQLLLLTVPAKVHAQYTYDIVPGTSVTITGYTGAGGAVTIPGSIEGLPVTTIGTSAFSLLTSLTSVTIPDSVTSIGNSAFAKCPNLVSVTIPNTVTSIGTQAFYRCPSLTSITIPDGVISIGGSAFSQCTGLTTVAIPASVTSIGNFAFGFCTGLASITVDPANSVFSSSGGVLYDKSQSTLIQAPGAIAGSFAIPASVTSIGSSAFFYCPGLTGVTMSSGVTSIGSLAFYGCTGLTGVTIPASVISIGSSALDACTGLASITVEPSNSAYSSAGGVLYDKGQTILIQAPGGIVGSVTIPATVTSIGSSAFSACTGLTSVTMSSGVTSIGSLAFYGCTGLTGVTIPNGVTDIGTSAFSGCSSLTGVTIPASVTSIGSQAFYACSLLASISVDPANSAYSSSGGVLYDKGQTTLLQCPGGKVGSVAIPASVTLILGSAFFQCSALASISVDPASSAYSSSGGVLYDKSQTTLLQCPGGKVGSVAIPAGVTSIEDSAFRDCSGLTGVTIPDGVTSIGNTAFFGCTSLTSVTIPGSVTSIGIQAFNTPSLRSAIFNGGAPAVGTNVFPAMGGFAVYFFDGAAGFTSPVWNGYPSVNMGPFSPISSWLVSWGFPYTTDLQTSPKGDGVSLLMSYALNLNPTQNQSLSIPRPTIAGGQISIVYYSGSPGVTYTPQISTDLIASWTTSGITISAPDANNFRTASAPCAGPSCFMRLKLDY